MPSMRKVEYKDHDGRYKVVLLPEDALDHEASKGILVGPPVLMDLNLPKETEIRLNNELFIRGIITKDDATRHRQEVVAALQAALKVDAGKVIDVYTGRGTLSGHEESSEEQPDKIVPDRRQGKPWKRTNLSDPYESFRSELAPGGSDTDQNP
jgi:hypothetical protein